MNYPTMLASVIVLSATVVAQVPPKPAPKPVPASKPQAPAAVQQTAAGMTNADVVSMVEVRLSDAIVTASIRDAKARSFDLTPNGLIALKKAGVSDGVIAVMLNPAAVLPTPSVVAPAARELKVPDGSEVRLRLSRPVSSETARLEDRVEFEVAQELKIDDVIVIDKGAVAVGRVTEAQQKRSFGRSGKLNFSIDTVKAVDGQAVRLRATRENRGADSFGKAGVVTILAGPFGALVRGKDVEIPAGTEYAIYIDGDRTILLKPAQ